MAESLTQLRARYEWDADTLRYRSPRGRFVSQRAVKQALNSYVRRSQREIARLAGQVANGALDVAEWQRLTANLVKSTHLASAAMAKGGWAQMTKADFGKVGRGLRFAYSRLEVFARQVESGRLTPKQTRARAGMYAASSGSVYENTRRDAAVAAGFDEEKNILGASEHCGGCKAQSERGWVPLGELVPVGQRDCLTNCRCSLRFRKREG